MEYHFFVFPGTLGFPLFNRQRRHHGCAGEAEWSMDATLRRLPEQPFFSKECLAALTGECRIRSRRTTAAFRQSNRKDSLPARKTRILRTVGISYRIKKIPCESAEYDSGKSSIFFATACENQQRISERTKRTPRKITL